MNTKGLVSIKGGAKQGMQDSFTTSPKKGKAKPKKDWKSLDMRKPGGMSILDLQRIQRKGYLNEPRIPETYFDQYGFEDKFSEEEIRTFKEGFIFFDRNGDGTMATDDLGLALRALGFLVTGNELKDLIKKLDPDGSGSIDLKDFLCSIADVSNKPDNSEVINQCFSVFDKESTGVIRIEEFRHVLKSIGDPLSEEELNTVLKDLDIYGDGALRLEDLVDTLSFRKDHPA